MRDEACVRASMAAQAEPELLSTADVCGGSGSIEAAPVAEPAPPESLCPSPALQAAWPVQLRGDGLACGVERSLCFDESREGAIALDAAGPLSGMSAG